MSDTHDEQTPLVWALRITHRARRDIDKAWLHLAGLVGEEIADAWQEGLENAIATLAQMPGRCPVASEAVLFSRPPVRQFIYRRTTKGPAYRVLFRMHDNSLDSPFVRIIAVRHGAQAPLIAGEAIQIDEES